MAAVGAGTRKPHKAAASDEQWSSLSRELLDDAAELAPEESRDALERREALLARITTALRATACGWTDATLHAYGSSASGLGFRRSDVDVCCVVDGVAAHLDGLAEVGARAAAESAAEREKRVEAITARQRKHIAHGKCKCIAPQICDE